MKKIILSFLFILICSSILPQTINIEGNTYYKNEGYWYLENANGHDFLVNDKVISIKFRNEINMDDGLKSMESQGVFLKEIRRNRLGYIDLEVPSSINLIDLYNQLKSNQSIKAVGINTYGTYNYNANDPQISQQWHINKIKANFGWDYSGGEDCIIIAILDSGSEWTHEDIGIGLDNYQNIWLNQNEDPWSDPNDPTTGNHFDNDGNGYIDDWKGWDFDFNNNDSRGIIGHGTNVTGIAGAKTDNNRGVAGVAGGLNHNGVQLMILNVGNITPNGAVLDDAIIYAVDNGADIIQMSLGVAWSQAIEAAIDDAYNNHNVLLVCASGNDSSSTVNFPSSDQNVIAVGSTSANDTKSSFSNYGADLEIAAPGENIYTTTLNNGYGNAGNGTSFAAPQVSATASLLLSIDQNLTPDEIRTILHNTADKVGGYNYNWNQNNPGHSLELGFGRLNVANAISFVFPTINGPTLVCSSGATFIVNNLPSGCTVSWTASPTNLFTVTSGSGNTFTTSWSGGFRVGYGTITATISSNCSNIIISKNAWMGKPLGPSSIERLPDYVCIGPEYYYEVGVLHLYPETVTSWDWDLQPPGIIIGSQTGSLLRFYYPNGTNPNSYSMGVSAINSCGQSGYRTAYFDVNDCGLRGALSFELFPNPASENVQINISFDQDPILKSQNTLSTYTVSIMNMFGATMYMSNQSGTQFTIPLNGLKDGNYIIDIYNTDNKSLRGQKTLIINH